MGVKVMRKESIDILKEINLDEWLINDLDKKIDNFRNKKRPEYCNGYYMGYIFALYDMGHIDDIDLDYLALEVENP